MQASTQEDQPASESSMVPSAGALQDAGPVVAALAEATAKPRFPTPRSSSGSRKHIVRFQPRPPSCAPPRLRSLCPGQLGQSVTLPSTCTNYSPVNLIHIPRTGGTTIERCTKDEESNSSRWGELNDVLHNNGKRTYLNKKAKCYGQHAPPSTITHYDGKETFCVVRNPYDRLISIFGYLNKMFRDSVGDCTIDNMNVRLLEYLKKVKKGARYLHDCHMLPQVAWVRGWDAEKGIPIPERRSCTYVLQYAHLVDDFNALMEKLGYHYRLTKTKLNPADPKCTALTKDSLAQEVRDLVEEVYKDDFEMLGFPRLPRQA